MTWPRFFSERRYEENRVIYPVSDRSTRIHYSDTAAFTLSL